jgi:pimeloyl-ACP methyl ester carboxylesterase
MKPWRAGAAAVAAGSLFGAATPAQTLAPCSVLGLGPRAECGTISVWENRTTRSGRKIPIRYAVLHAERPDGREPVFLFAGGPGEGSTVLGNLANGPLRPVRAIRDIVLVDQRGTGGSHPLDCTADLQSHPELAFGHVFDPARFHACRTRLEQTADLRFYTTELAVQDIDEVRAALGFGRVILYGGSYGTRMAQAYLRAYPGNVVAAVLDGVVPFDFRAPVSYAASAQQSLDRVIADCQADSTCSRVNPDLARAFGRLLARLRSGPVAAEVHTGSGTPVSVALSLGDFGYAVRGILYSAERSRSLPASIHRADSTGNLSPFAQLYWQRAVGLSSVAQGLHFAVYCAEETGFIDGNESAGLGQGTFLGHYLVDEYRNICREWVRAPLGPHARDAVTAAVPTLLLSGWFDPVTPPDIAERVAARLPNHRHLVVRNGAHGSGAGCALPATLHVLIEGRLEGLPRVCDGVTSLWSH